MVCNEFSDVSFGFEAAIWSSGHRRNGLFQTATAVGLLQFWLAVIVLGASADLCILSGNFLNVSGSELVLPSSFPNFVF